MNFIPVIFGGYVNGYSIARTFHETYGIRSSLCDWRKNFSRYSSFCDIYCVSDPKHMEKEFLKDIIQIGIKLKETNKIPIVIVTNDEWLIPLAKNQRNLEKYFKFSFSSWDIIERLTIKEHLYKLCDELNISYPRGFNCHLHNIKHIPSLNPPIIVKPSSVVSYISLFPYQPRNNIFSIVDEAIIFMEDKFTKGYKDSFIIQEYIPGGVENLYTITTYSDTRYKLKGVSIGHKLTQYPKNAGTITSGLVKFQPRIIEPSRKILESIKYFGITNAEYKYDMRDDSFKLIEINPRPGMWNYSTYISGINLFEMLVRDVFLKEELEYREGKNSAVWSVIDKKLVLKEIRDTENFAMVKQLFEKEKYINPMINSDENYLYKCNLCLLYFVNTIKSLIKKLLLRG